MPLDPRSAAWLAMLHRIRAPRLHELPVAQARHSFDKLMLAYRGTPPALPCDMLTLARRAHEGGPLRARLYRPAQTSPGPQAVILWLHGGGWTLGSLDAYDPWCRMLAEATGQAVCALDYRLAPEHRFPAGLDDAWFALRWLAREAPALGLDATRLAVAGDSAGGTLAAVLALQARDAGAPRLAAQILVYPATEMASGHAGPYASGHFLEAGTLDWFAHHYFESPVDAADWRASPARAPHHGGVAPALVLNAECDPLAAEGAAYAARLSAAGVPTRHVVYAGMVHGFATMFSLFDESRAVLADIAAALRTSYPPEPA
ncbi:MAG: alpha/beta hydrolase [Candidatus Dactylopiibacterium sp.]|nr:alpha/beta hydrolase [Candidatus Dactylopiibacterium sp.]